jgi:hypothetical protein
MSISVGLWNKVVGGKKYGKENADGMLHLTLIPKSGDATFVDASFPVLILDGYLWIGRNDDGIALPYFHADQQADTLKQPKG